MGPVLKLTAEELRKMQLIQLEMLSELDRVCRKHGIRYTLTGGTLLGAVRHKGFIPWDDDIDVALLRGEYDRLKAVAGEFDSSKYFFQDHETDPEYLWGYAKLRRVGTSYVRAGQEHIRARDGIFIDIFPYDDIPRGYYGQVLQNFGAFCLRKMLWAKVGKVTEKGWMRWWYQVLSVIPKRVIFALLRQIRVKGGTHCRCLMYPSYDAGREKSLRLWNAQTLAGRGAGL